MKLRRAKNEDMKDLDKWRILVHYMHDPVSEHGDRRATQEFALEKNLWPAN